ncbi:class I SAM-dependent DNA methyltransferase [Paenibacillus flagellatus]|uniref:SAM-dependent methyltransferase n=1 Tax=Paenibacillus flagellatus TaxID=2211139 RepID=A0A2V5JYY1_9BACL|nr:class I SAM-dependent methyltransferase [Paenibacillus flagellatus]PYI51961.1 SAM-dependent methyltransferase [Paenibacillus flagellatus]
MEEMPYPQWLRFVRQCWDRYGAPRSVVDLGCGTGNLSIPLAQSGLRVYGIDLSDDMLAVAQEKTERQERMFPFAPGGSVTWLQQDMREWELAEPVDSVLSCCDCINYLTEEDDLAATFRRTYAGLKDGGTFIFDVHTEGQLRSYAEMQPFVLNDDDISYIWTSELDEERCEIEHELAIFVRESEWGEERTAAADGAKYVRIDETHVQRAYPLDRIEALLREAGFADVRRYADFALKAPSVGTERAFFVALKKEGGHGA